MSIESSLWDIVPWLVERPSDWRALFQSIHTHPITPSVYLTLIWLAILRAGRDSLWKLALLSLPGTLLHELMHFIIGWILGAKPVSLDLSPHRDGDRWILGAVSFARINILNAAPTAFAPLLMLPIAWWLFQHWMVPVFVAGHYVEWMLVGYLVGCCVFSCFPSWMDIKLGTPSALVWAGLGYGAWYFEIFV